MGEDFAQPVRSKLERGSLGKLGHPLPPPAGKVRHEDIIAQVQLRLVQDDPAAGAASAAIEGAIELAAEVRRGPGVQRRRTWTRQELAADDLGNDVVGRSEHILVGCLLASGIGHLPGSIANEAFVPVRFHRHFRGTLPR
jgi:hypothetical protein